jgi:hypothetical protein
MSKLESIFLRLLSSSAQALSYLPLAFLRLAVWLEVILICVSRGDGTEPSTFSQRLGDSIRHTVHGVLLFLKLVGIFDVILS